ncbi:hypothetical protein Anas_08332 [Armadillidium nasatum]|uniref:Uncharacterized protein n=1 Tax=Armadillidium nasatum TaxID=96803 RepID=A0A5N5SQM0_9CRUS|nr:hypothetical protein Anas_08332 [Armadillidium nasatum]
MELLLLQSSLFAIRINSLNFYSRIYNSMILLIYVYTHLFVCMHICAEKRGIHTIDNQNFSYHYHEYKAKHFKKTLKLKSFNIVFILFKSFMSKKDVKFQHCDGSLLNYMRMKWKKENKTKVENGNPLSETPTPTPTSPPQ